MGRGRQKAKHTKVARELKYFSPNTNYGALERELTHSTGEQPEYIDKWADVIDSAPVADDSAADEYDDPYAVEYDDDDEDEAVGPHSKTA